MESAGPSYDPRYGGSQVPAYRGEITGGDGAEIAQSPIRDALGHAEQQLCELHDLITRFEQRLDTVVTPAPPAPTASAPGKSPGPPPSHVFGRLMILNEGYLAATQRLRDLMRRIEV